MPSSTAALGGVQRVFRRAPSFPSFRSPGRGVDIDDGHTADDLCQPLLELLAIVIRGGFLDLGLDLLHATFDLLRVAMAFDDRGVVLVDRDALGAAKIRQLDVLELQAEVLGDDLAAGEDRDVFQHAPCGDAEARGLHRRHVEGAAQLVDHQGRQRFAFDFFQ